MEFKRFSGDPIEDLDGTIWDWWGICPVTGDPVMQRSLAKAEFYLDFEIDYQELMYFREHLPDSIQPENHESEPGERYVVIVQRKKAVGA